MTKNYRDNAFSPEQLERNITIGVMSHSVSQFTNVDFVNMSHEDYLKWVNDWKRAYRLTSDTISAQKRNEEIRGSLPISTEQSDRMTFSSILRKFANTLLNARQYGKKIRLEVKNEVNRELIADALERHG